MAVKLDISKEYNQVEWGFLWNIMLKLGLDRKWVDMTIGTITTTSYSILINGELKSFITLTRGIKQRDLLSPYSCISYVVKAYLLY